VFEIVCGWVDASARIVAREPIGEILPVIVSRAG
jgi:hypothetical protein